MKAPAQSAHLPSTQRLASIAEDAYIFGYPLVLMDLTRAAMTSARAGTADTAPLNRFAHRAAFPETTRSCCAASAGILYSVAWLDVAAEPVVLSVPHLSDRYYQIQLLDAWSNVFAAPGTRTLGGLAADLAIGGPCWNGRMPSGLRLIRAPTATVLLTGRTQIDRRPPSGDPCAIEQQFALTPLHEWTHTQPPALPPAAPEPTDRLTPPAVQVEMMSAQDFLARLCRLMKDNPAAEIDAPMLRRLACIGIVPGADFAASDFDLPTAALLEQSVWLARGRLEFEAARGHGRRVNGWVILDDLGRYGTDYLFRAVVARESLGAGLPEDAICAHATVDADGRRLNGRHRYTIRFPCDAVPPVRAFWSLALCDADRRPVANPLDRHCLGDWDPLVLGEDGSLTLFIQHESPGDGRESNWLPAPDAPFTLVLRLYWPRRAVLERQWQPPAVRQAS